MLAFENTSSVPFLYGILKLYQRCLWTHHEFCSRPWNFAAVVWLLLNSVITSQQIYISWKVQLPRPWLYDYFLRAWVQDIDMQISVLRDIYFFCILTPPHPSNLLSAPLACFLSITPAKAPILFLPMSLADHVLEKYSSRTRRSSRWKLQEIGAISARRL